MMETILNVLDKQVVMLPSSQQQNKGLPSDDNQIKGTQGKESKTFIQREGYPDLFLLVVCYSMICLHKFHASCSLIRQCEIMPCIVFE